MERARTLFGRLALGLGVALLFLALAEGVLRLADAALGLSLHFDPLPTPPKIRVLCQQEGTELLYLCPDQGEDYERVRFEVFARAPAGARVITIGESFVYGLGLKAAQAWPAQLQGALGPGVEVLNFGRCGTYASVLMPLVEAAAELDPDVVVLAIGNNEHTMTSFFAGPLARRPARVYALATALSKWRLVGALNRLLGGNLTPRETIDPPAVMVGSEVDRQIFATRRRPPDLSVFGPLPLAGPEVTAAIEDEQRLKEQIFRARLTQMVALLQARGITAVLATLPWDLEAPPTLSGVDGAAEGEVRTGFGRLRSGGVDQASLEGMVQGAPHTSHFLHALASARLRAGDRQGAARLFAEATEWDLIPDVTPSLNAIIREVARQSQAPLVELAPLPEARLGTRERMFIDKVHVNAAGAQLVAAEVAPTVVTALKAGR